MLMEIPIVRGYVIRFHHNVDCVPGSHRKRTDAVMDFRPSGTLEKEKGENAMIAQKKEELSCIFFRWYNGKIIV